MDRLEILQAEVKILKELLEINEKQIVILSQRITELENNKE